MNGLTAIFLVYLLVLLGLAAWSRRETRSLDGYYLAGRQLPAWVVAFSTNATGESGWLLLGLTGMGYAVGAQALWVVAGEVIGIALAWFLVARRLKRLSDENAAITVPDVLVARFGDAWHILRGLSVAIILLMVGAYVAAQMVATGKAFGTFMGLEYATAVMLGGAVIVTYTFVGGYKAVAYTDLVQGILMLAGLVAVPLVAVSAAGGWEDVSRQLHAIDPDLLRPWGGAAGPRAWIAIASFLAIGLPFLGVPQLMVRFMSGRSERELHRASFVSVLVILLFDMGAVTAGMAGRVLFPGLADPETIFPTLARELFPPVLTGVLMVVVLAAIMSTVDSLLLLASSAVVRDFMQQIAGSTRSEGTLATYGKVLTLVIGVGGMAFALVESPLVFWFVLFAWSGLGASFGPVILCALLYPRTNLVGAVAGMLAGFLATMGWVLLFKARTHDLYEMIPGFSVGLFVTIVASHLSERHRLTPVGSGSAHAREDPARNDSPAPLRGCGGASDPPGTG